MFRQWSLDVNNGLHNPDRIGMVGTKKLLNARVPENETFSSYNVTS